MTNIIFKLPAGTCTVRRTYGGGHVKKKKQKLRYQKLSKIWILKKKITLPKGNVKMPFSQAIHDKQHPNRGSRRRILSKPGTRFAVTLPLKAVLGARLKGPGGPQGGSSLPSAPWACLPPVLALTPEVPAGPFRKTKNRAQGTGKWVEAQCGR